MVGSDGLAFLSVFCFMGKHNYFAQILLETLFVGQGKCHGQVKSFEYLCDMLSTRDTKDDLADVWTATCQFNIMSCC